MPSLRSTMAIVMFLLGAILLFSALAACSTALPSPTAMVVVTTAPTTTPVPVYTIKQTSTSTPTPTATPTPTPTRTRTPRPTRTPTLTPTPLPETVLLEPMNHQWQTFNNCGPASIAILLAYYDHWISQYTVNEQIDPGPSPCQIKDYFLQYGLMARAYWSSPSVEPVRRLLANGIPVIANQLLSPGSDIGHYRVIYGYNDGDQVFISDDPLLGESWSLSYSTFKKLSSGGGFIAVYPPQKDKRVKELLQDLRLIEITYCPP